MSNKMTPCEKLGYKVGDKFVVIEKSYMFNVGDVAILQSDDGSTCPFFTNDKVKEVYPRGVACFISDIKPMAKLKPAKQALADAIHQNGGWVGDNQYKYASSSKIGSVMFFTKMPSIDNGYWFSCGAGIAAYFTGSKLPNWHQTILSSDEYFTAYPEQLKVEVNNETEQKVEAEMKSESEMTIKVSDWHKNGELPPVGEVVMLNGKNPHDYYAHHAGAKLTVVAHDKNASGDGIAVYRFVDADGYNEYHGLVAHAFKPLCTERDKAIDEMMSVAAENWGNLQDCCERLYEYGYRKEVK